MSARASLSFGIAFAMLIALCTIAFSQQVVAQSSCPNGSVAITDATRPIATAAGFPTSVTCWNPSDPNSGQAAGDAKLYLQQHATHGAIVSCLNAQFSEQLQKMMQAVPSNLGTVLIDSAYRDPSTQAALVAKGASKVGACGTYHNYGLAADFNFSSKQVIAWIRANAAQYGLTVIGNSTTGCFSSGFCDPAHVQESGPLPPQSQCGICSSNVTGTQTAPAVSSTGVTSENFLYTPPSGSQIPAGYCLMSTSPLIYTPCSTSSYSPLPISTTPAVQTPLAPQTAPAVTTPTTVPPAVPNSSPTTATSAPALTPSPSIPQLQPITLFSSATSAAQILSTVTGAQNTVTTVWQAFTPASTSSAGEFPFGSNSYTVLGGGSPTSASGIAAATSDILAGNETYAQETFAPNYSQDFPSGASTQSSSPFSQVLSSLKGELANLLSYLQSL